MVAMEIDVLVGFNANSSSSKRREGTNLDTLSDFIKKKKSHFKSSYLAIQGSAKSKQRGETFEWQRKKNEERETNDRKKRVEDEEETEVTRELKIRRLKLKLTIKRLN